MFRDLATRQLSFGADERVVRRPDVLAMEENLHFIIDAKTAVQKLWRRSQFVVHTRAIPTR